jgi:hypothetical protein
MVDLPFRFLEGFFLRQLTDEFKLAVDADFEPLPIFRLAPGAIRHKRNLGENASLVKPSAGVNVDFLAP